jgi:hypothetical protein
LAITWSKFGVRENLILQNHSNNYELSKNNKNEGFPDIRSKENYERERPNDPVLSRYLSWIPPIDAPLSR